MGDIPREPPFKIDFTEDELLAALRLLNPGTRPPNALYAQILAAPADSPYLLPFQLAVALSVVSQRFRRAADALLAEEPPAVRAQFEQERKQLERIARGGSPLPDAGM